MHLHVLVAARPIQLECDRCADGWQRLNRRLGNMLDVELGIFARIRYPNHLLIETDHAGVAWLTTTQGIKDRSVKVNRAADLRGNHGGDHSGHRFGVRVLIKISLGHCRFSKIPP